MGMGKLEAALADIETITQGTGPGGFGSHYLEGVEEIDHLHCRIIDFLRSHMVTDEFKSVIAGLSPAVIVWQMNPAPLLSTFEMSPVFCNVAGVSLPQGMLAEFRR